VLEAPTPRSLPRAARLRIVTPRVQPFHLREPPCGQDFSRTTPHRDQRLPGSKNLPRFGNTDPLAKPYGCAVSPATDIGLVEIVRQAGLPRPGTSIEPDRARTQDNPVPHCGTKELSPARSAAECWVDSFYEGRVPAGTTLFRESAFGVPDKRRFCACWGDLQPERSLRTASRNSKLETAFGYESSSPPSTFVT